MDGYPFSGRSTFGEGMDAADYSNLPILASCVVLEQGVSRSHCSKAIVSRFVAFCSTNEDSMRGLLSNSTRVFHSRDLYHVES